MLRRIVVLFALTMTTAATIGCAVDQPTAEEEEPQASADSAFTGTVPTMTPISRPTGTVDSWSQPDSEGIFNQYGYCGATAAANLLRWYGKDVSPDNAIDNGCWSYIGTRPATLAAYLRNHHSELGCSLKKAGSSADALSTLKSNLAAGRPIIILFMTGGLNAHWVTVTAVEGEGNNASVTVMSWGGYYSMRWADLADAWRAGYSGPYPHITCNKRAEHGEGLAVR